MSEFFRTFAAQKVCKEKKNNSINNPNRIIMGEKSYVIPDSGCIDFLGEMPVGIPKPRVVRCGKKNKYNAPIEVKRAIRQGVRSLGVGESIDWHHVYA